MRTLKTYMLLLIFTFPNYVIGQPVLTDARIVDGVKVFPDLANDQTFYYAPGKLKINSDAMGKPDFKFVQMRYTGTRARADQSLKRFKSILKFGVLIESVNARQIEHIKSTLGVNGSQIILKPLPLAGIQAQLSYVAMKHDGPQDQETVSTAGGYFTSDGTVDQSIWLYRIYTIRLDDYASQLFWNAFFNNQNVLSVNYAFYSMGIAETSEPEIFSTDSLFMNQNDDIFSQKNDSIKLKNNRAMRMIYSDALNIHIDTRQFPDLLQQLDINQQIPPDYAAMDIYCYDFNNQIREDIYAKKIEIEAVGVGREIVKTHAIFKQSEQDVYAHNMRFRHSVRLDQPFRYRVIEVSKEGKNQVSAWKNQTSWTAIIDITTSHQNP